MTRRVQQRHAQRAQVSRVAFERATGRYGGELLEWIEEHTAGLDPEAWHAATWRRDRAGRQQRLIKDARALLQYILSPEPGVEIFRGDAHEPVVLVLRLPRLGEWHAWRMLSLASDFLVELGAAAHRHGDTNFVAVTCAAASVFESVLAFQQQQENDSGTNK